MSRGGPITCCPYCGSAAGIYTRTTFVNVPYHMGFDGSERDNSDMYDQAERLLGGQTAYCQACGRAICRLSTLKKQWSEAET